MESTSGARYAADVVRDYVTAIIKGHDVALDQAAVVADALVEADLRGIWSHGVNNLDLLVVSAIHAGGARPHAKVEAVGAMTGAVRHLDAHGALGPVAASVAVDLVKDLARRHGTGKVYLRNANHFGAGAIHSEGICSEKDLAGRVTCTTPALVVPHGGSQKRLGTNLISWTIPYDEGCVTIDIATTVHSVSGVIKAIVEGSVLPFPVLDQNGRETLDSSGFSGADDFLSRGALPSLGGLATRLEAAGAQAGHKGSGLAMLIELDSVIGAGRSTRVDPTAHDERRWIGQTFEAWRIDTLMAQQQALAEISSTIRDLRRYGGPDMLLPGEKEHKQRARALAVGLAYTPAQIERLNRTGAEVGLPPITPPAE